MPWWKRLIFIGIPIGVTILLAVGVHISRMKVTSWVRVYGLPRVQPGTRNAFRVVVRHGKDNKPATPAHIKAYLLGDGLRQFIGEGRADKGAQTIEINTVLPMWKPGKYRVQLDIRSTHVQESVAFPLELADPPDKLGWIHESMPGADGGNYVRMLTSPLRPDEDGVIVGIHPMNGRGFKMPFRDVLFLRAHDTQGFPRRVRAQLKMQRGRIRLPRNEECNPPFSRPEPDPCMIEIQDGQSVPFLLETDSLGLSSMALYVMTPGVVFLIDYQVQDGAGEWGPKRTMDFEVGIVEDDAFIATFPRVLPAGPDFVFPFRGLGRGPMYVDLYSETGWLRAESVPLSEMFGQTRLELEEPSGLRKLQISLFFIPIANSTVNATFWVHPQANNPRIIEDAIRMARRNENLDAHTLQYLSTLLDKGLIWQPGYVIESNIHFFAGLLDMFHYGPDVLTDTRDHKEAVLSRFKHSSQRMVLLMVGLSGLLLMVVIFVAVYLALRQRHKSQMKMSDIQKDEEGNETFWKNLHHSGEEKALRVQAVVFGVLVALIIGFIFVALMWVLFNIKWEM